MTLELAFEDYDRFYRQGDMPKLMETAGGRYYLMVRSLGRAEHYRSAAKSIGIDVDNVKANALFPYLFHAKPDETRLREVITNIYETGRATRRLEEPSLLAELFKLRVFDWGGIHQNDINRHIVDNYVKRFKSYDDLLTRIENELVESLKGFTLCSWYNNWTSILIEDIFNDHPRVVPSVGRIKMVDFFIDDIPFDLKVTYFPAGFMEEQRQARGLPKAELSELKKICKMHGMPYDRRREPIDLHQDIIAALSESSDDDVQQAYGEFIARRQEIIDEAVKDTKSLRRWLYEHQGLTRFDTSNRLFLILVDQNTMEHSWKLKRDHPLLKQQINRFLDQSSFASERLRTAWTHDGISYNSLSDVLFILKDDLRRSQPTS